MARLTAKTPAGKGNLRIIAGKHRGRKLSFPLTEGLRPTPDRVRETVFNWLAGHVEGAKCLDLFCGSGALGLEAISRAAADVTFVDCSAQAIASLHIHLQMLRESAVVCQQQAMSWLAEQPAGPDFDIVFLDPPFNKNMLLPVCQRIAEKKIIRTGGFVYVEAEAAISNLTVPGNWLIHRHQHAGDLQYALYTIT